MEYIKIKKTQEKYGAEPRGGIRQRHFIPFIDTPGLSFPLREGGYIYRLYMTCALKVDVPGL